MLGSDTNIWDVAVDATHVYWVSEGGVRRVAKGGGVVELLARGRFSRLALDDTDVYWGDATLQGVLAVAKRGGKPRFVIHGWLTGSQRLVVGQRALWVVHSDGVPLAWSWPWRFRAVVRPTISTAWPSPPPTSLSRPAEAR